MELHPMREQLYRTLTNGEKVLHTWMAYSPSKASLFCFCCHLFGHTNTSSESKFCSSNGFKNWQKLNPKAANHESSAQHNQNFCKWKELETRLQKGQTIDIYIYKTYMLWQRKQKSVEILVRMFDVIKFLVNRIWLFVVTEKTIPAQTEATYNWCISLQSTIQYSKNALCTGKMGPKILVTNMSPQIQNEFIGISGNKVRQQIICQVQKAKYYSIICDNTPDISHNDQTSQVVQ
ncbi:uncharacterized protein LOC118182200 [Stegodyphus dumicola]|uniref:uncharacterized protein LOC118182200 n=1 Tax=Stegodyphus dumicola TaxID=202533 RepID=UPI0015B0719E|nr:uncharacterized protein LOC118182200 [Stegodyphus dumicola]